MPLQVIPRCAITGCMERMVNGSGQMPTSGWSLECPHPLPLGPHYPTHPHRMEGSLVVPRGYAITAHYKRAALVSATVSAVIVQQVVDVWNVVRLHCGKCSHPHHWCILTFDDATVETADNLQQKTHLFRYITNSAMPSNLHGRQWNAARQTASDETPTKPNDIQRHQTTFNSIPSIIRCHPTQVTSAR